MACLNLQRISGKPCSLPLKKKKKNKIKINARSRSRIRSGKCNRTEEIQSRRRSSLFDGVVREGICLCYFSMSEFEYEYANSKGNLIYVI